MNLFTYIKEIHQLNIETLRPAYDSKSYAALTTGVIEEYLELGDAVTEDEVAKELGDVICYIVLILLANTIVDPVHFGLDWFDRVAAHIEAYLESGDPETITPTYLAKVIKRYYREDFDFLPTLVNLYVYLVQGKYGNLSLPKILEINVSKLKSRKTRGTLMTGFGEER